MAETRKQKTPPAPARSSKVTTEIVVRRGALRRFDTLKRKTSDLPVVVTWDRRQTERRASSGDVSTDRRRLDRRQKPPFTWELAEFVVVAPRPPLPVPRRAKSSKGVAAPRGR